MALPKAQNALDWLTQAWNIALGKPVDKGADSWLLGPIGRIGETVESYVCRIAAENDLTIKRNEPGVGLIDDLGVALNRRIQAFYHRTLDFELDARTAWRPVFGSLGDVIRRVFSRRIQQLNLPPTSEDQSLAIQSEIIRLVDTSGRTVYRVWYRRLRRNDEVIFYGIYTHCRLPSGEFCLKVVFPLPEGSATVIFRICADGNGNLELISAGKKHGDPGFYFLVEDQAGCLWRHYLPSFSERIRVFEDETGSLRAHHAMTLWSLPVYEMNYQIVEKQSACPVPSL